MLRYFLKLYFLVILITNIYSMPQFSHINAGLLEEFLSNREIFDGSAKYQHLRNPAKRNIDINEVVVDQSSNLFGVANRESDIAEIPIAANIPLKVIDKNTQIATGPGGIENFDKSTQILDQSSRLVGVNNVDSNLAQIPIAVDVPLKVIAQNTQISEDPGGIDNFRSVNQIADQSTLLTGIDNSKLSGVQAPIAAAVPVNVLTKNFQLVTNAEGGNINNKDISNQFLDQSSQLLGVGNSESVLAQVPVGAQLPVNILTQNEQMIAGSDGSFTNIDLKKQEVDQSSILKGENLSKSQLLKVPALIGGALNILNSNKQIIEEDGNTVGTNQPGGITNVIGKLQTIDLSDTLEGENIRKADGLVLAPEELLTLSGLNKNSQNTAGGSIDNNEINVQKLNSSTNIAGSDNSKVQLGQVAPQLNIVSKLLNSNQQTSTGDGNLGSITDTTLNEQDISNQILINGSNTNIVKLLDINPQILLDLGLVEFTDQQTGGQGSALHGDITKQKSNSSITIIGDNNSVLRGATVDTQAAVKLRLLELVKQTTGLISGKLTDEECEALKDDAIIQEQINDITQIGNNNTVTTLAKVGGQLAVDGDVAVKIIQKIRCGNRMTTVKPVTQSPIQPPTQAPTQPPTQRPTQPPTQPPIQPPIQPPTQPPIQPPRQPTTQPPIQPPTPPPTQPPTVPAIKPPTTPSTPSRRCYRNYCRKWRKICYICGQPKDEYYDSNVGIS